MLTSRHPSYISFQEQERMKPRKKAHSSMDPNQFSLPPHLGASSFCKSSDPNTFSVLFLGDSAIALTQILPPPEASKVIYNLRNLLTYIQ